MKYLFASLLSLLVITIIAGHAISFDGGYSPGFEPFASVKLFPIEQCKAKQSTANPDTYICSDKKGKWTVEMERDKDKPILILSGNKSVQYQYKIGDKIPPYLEEVYAADLNNDGIADFILVSQGGGSGLANEFCIVTFVLSELKGYALVSMLTMGFGPEDIIDYYENKSPVIVHTSFINGDIGKDGKLHNYWVYNFFKVAESKILLDKHLEQRWIMFAGKTNHRPTIQLTKEQKERLWSQQQRPFFIENIQ